MSAAFDTNGYGDWYADAACRDQGTALWFSSGRRFTKRAIAVCHECPVESYCLHLALRHPDLVGVWGGTDEHQRARIRERRDGAANSARRAHPAAGTGRSPATM